jgi:uncharacterized protein
MLRIFLCLAVSVLAVGCGDRISSVDQYLTEDVALPNGKHLRVEVMRKPEDMIRGMMFRDSLAPNRGMLFVHGSPGKHPYFMYQCRIPLDMVWMDLNHRVVEMAGNVPPCKTKASACPVYGGQQDSVFVLELAGGMAKKYNLRLGDTLAF